MQNPSSSLSRNEQIILNLRSLFGSYGYTGCRVGPFETYDFYSRNRSALAGEDVLIFTDADGSLKALKPDVTMSIVKHIQDRMPGLRKYSYNENVYRIPTGGNSFRETVQTGLECIGDLDDYAIGEVLMLAMKSLRSIRSGYVLNLSHLGILEGLLSQALPEDADRRSILRAMEQKNLPALHQACSTLGIEDTFQDSLTLLTTLYGPLRSTLPEIRPLIQGEQMEEAYARLENIRDLMEEYGLGDHLHLDFSISGGMDYYSGLLFRGFVDNASSPVLSGGQYDQLIARMGKQAGGIGFAVYLSQLGRSAHPDREDQVLLLYDEEVPASQVIHTVSVLKQDGLQVRADRVIPGDCSYGRLFRLTKDGVTEIE